MIQAARAQVAELTQAAYERAAAAGVLTGGAEVKATVEIPKDTAHGDYASSFAMAGAKALHMAPRAIAQAIVDHMDLTGSYFQKVDIAGPGFLNFTLGPKWYGQVLARRWRQEGPELRLRQRRKGRAGDGGVRLRQPHRPHAHGQRPWRRAGRHPGQPC